VIKYGKEEKTINLLYMREPTVSINNRQIHPKKMAVFALVLVLLAINFLLIIKYFSLKAELERTSQAVESRQINEKTLNFAGLFIEKVLKAKTEIDFETRLQLENAVRALDDSQILGQWNKFVESQTEEQAQEEVKNLLELLAKKIKVK